MTYSDSTLMHMTKRELIEFLRVAEHNRDVVEARFNQQYEKVKDWQPVRHGKWIEVKRQDGTIVFQCPYCKDAAYTKNPYCRICGTKMDGENS